MNSVRAVDACRGDRPLIVGTVGTDHHRFDRLVDWMDAWVARRTQTAPPRFEALIQHGTSRTPEFARAAALLDATEFASVLGRAAAVVTCGPGTMMECRQAGLLPIALPRRGELDEHVDDHQVAFARHAAAHGLVHLVESELELAAALDAALDDPDRYRIAVAPGPAAAIARIAALVAALAAGGGAER